MSAASRVFALMAAAVGSSAVASESAASAPPAAAASSPAWEFAITAYPTIVRNGDNYTSGIVAADRGPLHLEARVNYESVGARSAFIGWSFSGGDEITWELRPLLGGAWGSIRAFVPGLQASLGWGRFDFYIESEYVVDHDDRDSNYLYSWSELGFRPVEWLRAGLVAQRTRVYGGEREIQRGPFVQLTWRSLTVGGFWFNPGSADQVVVVSLGAAF